MNRKTILWIDDASEDLELFKYILTDLSNDHYIIECRNGQEGLKKLKKLKGAELPNLIVMDLNMPVLDGRDTLLQLNNDPSLSTIPVVIFTSSNNEIDRIFCANNHVEMITKPIDFEQVKKVLQNILNKL